MPMVNAGLSNMSETLDGGRHHASAFFGARDSVGGTPHRLTPDMFTVEIGEDGKSRCWWGATPPDYQTYHDSEWGYPVADDRTLFEKLCLEGFQSGLAWITILRKRDNFRAAFHDFSISKVAEMGPADVERLLGDAGIVRHRGKIESTINNAGQALALIEEEGSLAHFFWSYEPDTSDIGDSQTPESAAMSKELKRRGFTWVGPTTAYAFMQAMGLVNDHLSDCYFREKATAARAVFTKP